MYKCYIIRITNVGDSYYTVIHEDSLLLLKDYLSDIFHDPVIFYDEVDDFEDISNLSVLESPYHIENVYAIFAGLGGGFGGANFVTLQVFNDMNEANDYALIEATEEYESYEGLHGIRSLEDIMEEDDLTVEEAESQYSEEVESWLDYYAIKIS